MTKPRPGLLLLLAPVDHPHRDQVCATLAWLAEARGVFFECYYGGWASGAHLGGGHPSWHDAADLRGGPPSGGHHVETLYLLLQRFDVAAACLGASIFDGVMAEAGVAVHSRSGRVDRFYREVFAAMQQLWPDTLLVVGDGGSPEGVALSAYAYPEIVNRQALAIRDDDREALSALAPGVTLDSLWVTPGSRGRWAEAGVELAGSVGEPNEALVSAQTAWLARRWPQWNGGVLLADPELAGRWTPTAVRRRWLPLFGFPQSQVLDEGPSQLREAPLVHGRQQDDRDFLELSQRGQAFQLIDPGRPAFPVLAEFPAPLPRRPCHDVEPTATQLDDWAAQGRVLSSLLFWTGMIRELESLYPLTDILGQTSARAGLILSTESFRYMSDLPLGLVNVPREAGGLFPRVEVLLASAGVGTVIESAAPADRFSALLRTSVEALSEQLGGDPIMPRGWWAVMDAPLLPNRQRRVGRRSPGWPIRLRYEPRPLAGGQGSKGTIDSPSRDLRARVRDSPLSELFEPIRPFDAVRPGEPMPAVLEAVRQAGFEYAFSKSSFGRAPRVVDAGGMTVLNETAGRWDGWTPFVTVGSLNDLRRAEKRLLAGGPGWLVGTLDTCLWAFSGPLLSRGEDLKRMCAWLAAGGESGQLVNVTPRTVARYADVLAKRSLVERVSIGA